MKCQVTMYVIYLSLPHKRCPFLVSAHLGLPLAFQISYIPLRPGSMPCGLHFSAFQIPSVRLGPPSDTSCLLHFCQCYMCLHVWIVVETLSTHPLLLMPGPIQLPPESEWEHLSVEETAHLRPLPCLE